MRGTRSKADITDQKSTDYLELEIELRISPMISPEVGVQR